MELSFLQLFFVLCIHFVGVRSEVDGDFNKCDHFFYKNTPPQLGRHFNQPPKEICQRFQNDYRYATLYSTDLRIPLYSAYTDEGPCQGQQDNRRAAWFVEPQVSKERENFLNHVRWLNWVLFEPHLRCLITKCIAA